jgi:hypothetical protein
MQKDPALRRAAPTNSGRISARPMRHREASQAVRHDESVVVALRQLMFDCRYPIVACNLIPVFDDESLPVRMRCLPYTLPVQWTGISNTGNNEHGVDHLLALHH